MAMMKSIRVLLVDDEAHVRQALKMRLELEADIDVVGAAPGGEAGIALARELSPDVVLMDVSMDEMNGLSATHELHSAVPGVAVVMLTMMDNDQTRLLARYAGAVEFVGKHQPDDALLTAIRKAGRPE
jgi:DNA-binding NarL/FixJ family response regulator